MELSDDYLALYGQRKKCFQLKEELTGEISEYLPEMLTRKALYFLCLPDSQAAREHSEMHQNLVRIMVPKLALYDEQVELIEKITRKLNELEAAAR